MASAHLRLQGRAYNGGVLLGLRQVEATKFTEVGFMGGDVEQIIKDLVDNALLVTRKRVSAKIHQEV